MTDERLWCRIKELVSDEFELVHIAIPLCEDFDQLCDILDGYFKEEKINLLGFSFGSYIGAYYAIKNPSKINRLFLLAGSASFLLEDEIQRRKESIKLMDNFGFKGLSRKKILDLIEDKNHDDIQLINTIKDMFFDLGLDTYKNQMELSFKRDDISEELSSLNMPITLFYASHDKLFDYTALAKIKKKNRENIKMIEKEGSSHFIPLEEPNALIREIKNWMCD